MPINNVKSFTVVGRGDVFLLDPNGSYTITTIGALGGASDVHVHEATVDIASVDDASLATNWSLLRDTGLSGEAAALAVGAGVKKLLVDVIDGTEGVVITVAQTGALTGAFDKSQGLLSANNQRQKFSSAVRRVN
jgi:hypothetical protein